MPAAPRPSTRHAQPTHAAQQKPRKSALNAATQQDVSGDEGGAGIKGELDRRYLNQPVRPELAEKRMRTLQAEWSNLEKKLIEAITPLSEVAANMEECNVAEDDAEMTQAVAALDADVRTILDKVEECRICRLELQSIMQRFQAGEHIPKAFEEYEANTKATVEAYHQKTARSKYAKSKLYSEHRGTIWNAKHSGEPVPNVKRWLDRAEGDSSDDEVEVAAATVDLRDPITMMPMTEPVVNDNCIHRCEKSSIEEMLASARGAIECPIAGCNARWTKSSFKLDEALKRRIRQEASRNKRARPATQKTVDLDLEDE